MPLNRFPRKLLRVYASWLLAFVFSTAFFQCSEEAPLSPRDTPSEGNVPDTGKAAASSVTCATCTYVVPANKGIIDGAVLGIQPGDVICLDAAFQYGTLTFKNIIGTASNPVTITNCGGTVKIAVSGRPFNMKTSNSKYFRITGGSTAGAYGIQFSGSTSNGVVLCELSTNFEVDHIEVHHVGFAGIMAKTDPTCDNATVRGNFTMRDISIHDNYIHDTGGEGFYIGHTSYDGHNTGCGKRLPHTIENSKIYANVVKNTAWDGIQVSCATKQAAIYGNTIENYGTANKADQKTGILLGGGTGGLCYGNYINTGTGPGLMSFGLGDNVIHDNVIVNAGSMGIFCDERGTSGPGGPGYKFFHNTIIDPKGEGIRIYTESMPGNVFANNIVVNPGSYGTYGEASYAMLLKGVKADIGQNYFTRTIATVKFADVNARNYRLQTGSPAIDIGRDVSPFNIARDFYDAPRLKGAAYDAGASEH